MPLYDAKSGSVMQKTLDKPKKKDYSLYYIVNVLTGTPDPSLFSESRCVVRSGKRTDQWVITLEQACRTVRF